MLPGCRVTRVFGCERYQVHCKRAKEFKYARLLLAGDAAHTLEPILASGLNLGIQVKVVKGLSSLLGLVFTRRVSRDDYRGVFLYLFAAGRVQLGLEIGASVASWSEHTVALVVLRGERTSGR